MTGNAPSATDPFEKTGYHAKPITEVIANGFFAVDESWTVKFWNKAAEELLGVLAANIIGKNLWEEFARAVPADFYAAYHKALIVDIPAHFEEYWEKAGTWFDVRTYYHDGTLSISFRRRGQPAGSKNPEKDLQSLHELYRFISEVTNDCLWEWDLQTGQIFWIDGGHERVYGYPIVNTLIPQSFWENHLHPADKPRILKRLSAVLAERTGSIWEDEYRFQRADGSYASVHDRGHIIYSVEGFPLRMVGATQDITARKSAEIQLLETERKLAEERLTKQKELIHAVQSAQENERAEIGKELHDNLSQILGAAKLYIEMARTDEESRDMCLDKSSSFIVKVIEEIRKISKSLSTPSMVMGLLESIDMLLDDLSMINTVKIEFTVANIDEEELDERLRLTIFRIVQEQLNNILKHSEATVAKIKLIREENNIVLRISDNGNGSDMLPNEKGIGNVNIKSRVEFYCGSVRIVSKPGEGYELKVVLPVAGRKQNSTPLA